jgi:bifunctional non-homologous end joining protein LigD
MAETTVRSIELFFQEQPSDKVYNVALVCEDGAYTVRVEWGRRGANLSRGTKAVKVELAAAEKAYDKVVRQKTRKGYEVATADNRPAEVAPPAGEGSASKVAGDQRARLAQRAQLLNPVAESELEALVTSDALVAQQKLDGMRVLLHVVDGQVVATNREGQITAVAAAITGAFCGAPEGTIFDGELVGDRYWAFDLLAYGDEDLREAGYVDRYERLAGVGVETDEVALVPTAWTEADKRRLLAALEAASAEGIVFKERDAPYTMGRPASRGAQLKFKFTKSADVVIVENAGNAYRMAVYHEGELHIAGKVFAGTTNESRAELDRLLAGGVNPVAEVRYLYATDDHVLYQPVFVRLRDDKPAVECLRDQLIQTDRRGLTEI